MNVVSPFKKKLPNQAEPALAVITRLRSGGYTALLAGGCVRDLLLEHPVSDYDVATDATPDQVAETFRHTRKVGAQFGVMLVRSNGEWIEVATFRRDADYADGRRPTHVTFAAPEEDAQRRDFTINGMFLDPHAEQVRDYVGGRSDLKSRQIRAIGTASQRFAEDHLRLLRAIRFAARLDFAVEPQTSAAIRAHADRLARIAAERRRDELEKILRHQTRAGAFEMLADHDLLMPLWGDSDWSADRVTTCREQLARLPEDAGFSLSMAILLHGRSHTRIAEIARALTCSNQQLSQMQWLNQHRADLLGPPLRLADLKKLVAHPGYSALRTLVAAQHPDAGSRLQELDARVAGLDPELLQPEPFIRGDDLAGRGLPKGPIYKDLLAALYDRQLDEEFPDRHAALDALEQLVREAGAE